jgi:anti-sigma factor RsiW
MKREERDNLLLHWSGELDESQKARVEALLAADAEAREYAEELDGLQRDLRACPVPSPAGGGVRRALERHRSVRAAQMKSRQLPRFAAVAAMFLLGFGLASLVSTHRPAHVPPARGSSLAARNGNRGSATARASARDRKPGARRKRSSSRRRIFRRKNSPTLKRLAKLKERIHGLRSKFVQ